MPPDAMSVRSPLINFHKTKQKCWGKEKATYERLPGKKHGKQG